MCVCVHICMHVCMFIHVSVFEATYLCATISLRAIKSGNNSADMAAVTEDNKNQICNKSKNNT